MRSSLVLTIIGPDRPGLVEGVASAVAEHGGNWVESRMARLGGQFAGILLVDVPREGRDTLKQALFRLESQGLRLSIESSDDAEAAAPPSTTIRFELLGHDRPGIVRHVSRALAQRQVNVVELTTEVYSAPMTGEPLFRAEIEAAVPEGADADDVRAALERAADELSMDLTFE